MTMIGTQRRQGIATPMALALTAVAAAAMLALVSLLSFEIRRTRQAAIDAKLRQLLASAAEVAGDRVGKDDDSQPASTLPVEMPLPVSLQQEAVKVQLTRLPADGSDSGVTRGLLRRIRIDVKVDGGYASQLLVYQRLSDLKWQLKDVSALESAPPGSAVPHATSMPDNAATKPSL